MASGNSTEKSLEEEKPFTRDSQSKSCGKVSKSPSRKTSRELEIVEARAARLGAKPIGGIDFFKFRLEEEKPFTRDSRSKSCGKVVPAGPSSQFFQVSPSVQKPLSKQLF